MSAKPQTEFYHVVVWMHPAAGVASQIFHDLTERELRSQFVKPYNHGATVKIGSDIHDFTKIASTNIIRTDKPLRQIRQAAFQRSQERNTELYNSGIFMLSGNSWQQDDIVNEGEDVTSQFLKVAPGQGFTWKKLALNPYILSGASVIFGSLATLLVGAILPTTDKPASECPPAQVATQGKQIVSSAAPKAEPKNTTGAKVGPVPSNNSN